MASSKKGNPSESASKRTPKGSSKSSSVKIDRQHMISEAAYYLAEHRGFSEGSELNDWLQAEQQIDSISK